MTAPNQCPFCGSAHLVPGQVRSSEAYGFKPEAAERGAFTFRSVYAFDFGPAATFCLKCSMVWSQADPKDAAAFIRKFGTESLQAQLTAAAPNPPN